MDTNPSEKFSDLEKTIHRYDDELIKAEFGVEAKVFFHYTEAEAAEAIIKSQIFNASFIRSSSDSLEFSSPMSACRDCVCMTHNFFSHQVFPVKLFKHFNEQATAPSARAYFISLSGNTGSVHLKSMYGEIPIEFKLNTEVTDFNSYGFLIKCKYIPDTRKEVFRLLKRWKEEVLERAFQEHQVDNPTKNIEEWFYTLMKFCNMISLGIKQEAFHPEEESRIVVFPRTPDQETHWHLNRATKLLNSTSILLREYLPLKLGGMGIEACKL